MIKSVSALQLSAMIDRFYKYMYQSVSMLTVYLISYCRCELSKTLEVFLSTRKILSKISESLYYRTSPSYAKATFETILVKLPGSSKSEVWPCRLQSVSIQVFVWATDHNENNLKSTALNKTNKTLWAS